MTNRIVVVIGGPASGKGIQCKLIAQKCDFIHLSVGDLLRNQTNSGSDTGDYIEKILMTGKLVSNQVVLDILLDEIQRARNHSNVLIIDGFPRQLDQAIDFENHGYKIDLVIYLDCSDEHMVERLEGSDLRIGKVVNREDIINTILRTFRENIDPILEYYGERVVTIDVNRDPYVVFAEVTAHLDKLYFNKV